MNNKKIKTINDSASEGRKVWWWSELSNQTPGFAHPASPLVSFWEGAYFLLSLLGWHWFTKPYRFQMNNSIKHHLYIAYYVPQWSLFPSPFSPPLPTTNYLPPPSPSGYHHACLGVWLAHAKHSVNVCELRECESQCSVLIRHLKVTFMESLLCAGHLYILYLI